MERQKRWQLVLIISVVILTLYNILPTIFYYSKPLRQPIDAERAHEAAQGIVERVDGLEESSHEWLAAFCKHLRIKPESIKTKSNDPRVIEVAFKTGSDISLFEKMLPHAGSLIPFVPAQLELRGRHPADLNTVLVERRVGVRLEPGEIDTLFRFSTKLDENHQPTDFYRGLVYDRVIRLGMGLTGVSDRARQLVAVVEHGDAAYDDMALALATDIVDVKHALGSDSSLAKRCYATFTRIDRADKAALIQKFIARLEAISTRTDAQQKTIAKEQEELTSKGQLPDASKEQMLKVLASHRQTAQSAVEILRKQTSDFAAGTAPMTEQAFADLLKGATKTHPQTIQIGTYNPFVKEIAIDWSNDAVTLRLYDDLLKIRAEEVSVSEEEAFRKDKINQLIINEIARVSRLSDESLLPALDGFALHLNTLTSSSSVLTMNLGVIANKFIKQLKNELVTTWAPKNPDLSPANYPLYDYETFSKLSLQESKLGMVVYAPSMYDTAPPEGFRSGSVYVIARGMGSIVQKYKEFPNAEGVQAFSQDFNELVRILQQYGFIGYPGTSFGVASDYSRDFIFELEDYYSNLLKGSREEFSVNGSKRYAVLEFTDVEQRILAQNKIDDSMHEDLLKWREEYQAAQVDVNPVQKLVVPPPARNVYWDNLKLSMRKYFRGDDRKILRWGLDLSGGKTVRIGLRDANNRMVTEPDDLKQAVNELYTRINKMGVSERSIRIENESIILDFPGSQGISASELVKASAMYFHIVNEKFSSNNQGLAEAVNGFLQEVWNEAVVTNRKDLESLNDIAWKHLGGDDQEGLRPRSEYAKLLVQSGLKLAGPKDQARSTGFNDTLSMVGMYRGSDYSQWYGQSHPLLVLFHNHALDGSSLTNVQAGYDPSEGNVLSFGIKSSYEGAAARNREGSPRDDFYNWTSQFSEERIVGTPKETYSRGRGWRMAVVLNDTIINAPSLKAALRDGATISGHFSQREITQLAADLKAGSLSFTPRILSEHNVSPELGLEERSKGIYAAFIGLLLVIALMVGYYRFAGVVACIAVLFNLLIMWGVLQNLGAALSLPGIAGIVLTMGMAVDANVLVFERVREEFRISGRIGSAIQAGYRKAFSAIVDSNLTTILAAAILMQFDSGPIKGFAVTLIIGVISSMFTALFMTRYYFAGWVKNPEHKELKMADFVGRTHFDFLKWTKPAAAIAIGLILIGSFFMVTQRNQIFGMDFTGGYALTVEYEEKADTNYRLATTQALTAQHAPSTAVRVQQLSRANQIRIQFGMAMEEAGNPFHGMSRELTEGQFAYGYQKDPRINWVVDALNKGDLRVQQANLVSLDKNWTVMSGQLSDAMRNNAILALALALLGILIYITIRFEFKYALAAVIGLLNDVMLSVGALAILHALGASVEIDLQVVGAIMTILGYALNDKIIVFDRIREEMKLRRKMSAYDIVNYSLNVTLNRTLMTSGTTLMVLLALVLFGGSSIFSFSLVMTIGVFYGTLSSLFISAPAMLYFHNRELRKQEEAAELKHA